MLDVDRDLARLRSRHGIKWSRYDDTVIPAFVADMDFDQAAPVKDAMRAMIDRGDLGDDPALHDELVPAWLRWCADRHGLDVPEGECRSFAGVLHALEVALTWCSEPGDGVVLFSPMYHPFRAAIVDSGRRVVDVPLGTGFGLDRERLDDALDRFDGRTRVVRTLVEQAGIALSSGLLCGEQGRGHARLDFATTAPILDEILDRLVTAIRNGVTP